MRHCCCHASPVFAIGGWTESARQRSHKRVPRNCQEQPQTHTHTLCSEVRVAPLPWPRARTKEEAGGLTPHLRWHHAGTCATLMTRPHLRQSSPLQPTVTLTLQGRARTAPPAAAAAAVMTHPCRNGRRGRQRHHAGLHSSFAGPHSLHRRPWRLPPQLHRRLPCRDRCGVVAAVSSSAVANSAPEPLPLAPPGRALPATCGGVAQTQHSTHAIDASRSVPLPWRESGPRGDGAALPPPTSQRRAPVEYALPHSARRPLNTPPSYRCH
jgi:hypothetical protein